ncbi:hypothetical protein PSUM_16035 [Pseudomonas umsongensis]|uniref:Uncharacterized protein n=1 Tax=Pseudomonas umsongensis TaxID=198618 RepID=A0ABX4DXW1_9PSED|nr:hypothetical protein [Pseudomonas umsongensis]OXR33521.1 hypothetical protein PSUM_16035 [Pseudomonas umsongensis]SDS63488.1 hypothetical protein SAMN04490206_1121 [Pseudomonas umsongensis]
MNSSWPVWAALIFNGGPILLGFVSFAYALYLGRHLDAMMEALKNSRCIYIWGPGLRKQGWFGCFLLVTKITGVVMMPKTSIRLGELDPVDIENFPPYLKRLLQVDAVILVGGAIWLVVACLLVKI